MFFQAYSFYGLSAILWLYLSDELNFQSNTADSLVHWFICATFVFSMVGGAISDHGFGKVKTIIVSGLIWIAGAALLIWASYPTVHLVQQ